MLAQSSERLPAGWTVQFEVQKNGRKKKCYMNPGTGQKFFSKEDLLRYIKVERTLHDPKPSISCSRRPTENSDIKLRIPKPISDCSRRPSKNSDIKLKVPKPISDSGRRHSENSNIKPVANENGHPDWLPDGWVVDLKTRKSGVRIGSSYKIYTDPLTGCKFLSKLEVLRYLKSAKSKSCSSKQKETRNLESAKLKSSSSKRKKTRKKTCSASKVVVEKSTVADLPPGWVKETKIRKSAFGIRRDPYYVDPVSGYVFRSKKDVFRYLESGEISRHAFKPYKTDAQDLGALPLPAAKRQKLEHSATRRRLFPAKESSEAEALNKRQGKRVSAENGLVGASAAEISPGKMVIVEDAEAKKTSSFGYSVLPKPKFPKGDEGNMSFSDNGRVSTPATYTPQGKNSLDCGIECSGGKSLKNSNKSEDKKKLCLPRRSSKRLAGQEPELVVDNVSTERIFKKQTAESCKSEAISAADLTSNGLAAEVSKNLNVGPVINMANCVSSEVNNSSREGQSQKIKPLWNKLIPGQQMQKMESTGSNDDKSEPNLSFPYSQLDPCLEFAFGTVTGEIAVDGIPENKPVSTPAADILQGKSLELTNMETCSAKNVDSNSIKSKKKKELNLPCRSSRRLAGFEPELVPDSTVSERALLNATRKFKVSEAAADAGLYPSSLEDGVSRCLDAGHITTLAHHADINFPSCEQSLTMNEKPLELQSVSEGQSQLENNDKSEGQHQQLKNVKPEWLPQQCENENLKGLPQRLENEMLEGQAQQMENENLVEQPQQVQNKNMNNENSESHPVLPFEDPWLDPCLEFAFKTLTGAIPVDDNLAIHDYIQHQLRASQTVGKPDLPHLSMHSFSQTDVSFQFDIAEKQMAAQQQFSETPLRSLGNVSLPSFSGIASQQPGLEGNKEVQGVLKS